MFQLLCSRSPFLRELRRGQPVKSFSNPRWPVGQENHAIRWDRWGDVSPLHPRTALNSVSVEDGVGLVGHGDEIQDSSSTGNRTRGIDVHIAGRLRGIGAGDIFL